MAPAPEPPPPTFRPSGLAVPPLEGGLSWLVRVVTPGPGLAALPVSVVDGSDCDLASRMETESRRRTDAVSDTMDALITLVFIVPPCSTLRIAGVRTGFQ
jgi:hypothetical protein